MNIDLTKLACCFDPDDIEWRIGRCGLKDNKPWATALAYVTNRAIMNRLDEVCTPGLWRNEYKPWTVGAQFGVLCGISIKVGDEWVTKWDGAENTDIEPIKGGLSDSMKRAGVQWGIGRYLYKLTESYVDCSTDRKTPPHWHYAKDKEKNVFYWRTPELPDWAMPKASAAAPATPKATKSTNDQSDAHREMYNTASAKMNVAKACGDVDQIYDDAIAAGLDGEWKSKLENFGTARKTVIQPLSSNGNGKSAGKSSNGHSEPKKRKIEMDAEGYVVSTYDHDLLRTCDKRVRDNENMTQEEKTRLLAKIDAQLKKSAESQDHVKPSMEEGVLQA